MTNSNTDMFNEHLTRAVAQLYEAHPATIYLPSDNLWEPPITQRDADYQHKSPISAGTLTWLYRNGFVGGDYSPRGLGCEIVGAQLTSSGYRIAHRKEGNYGGSPLGDVAVSATKSPDNSRSIRDFEFVAGRFTGA